MCCSVLQCVCGYLWLRPWYKTPQICFSCPLWSEEQPTAACGCDCAIKSEKQWQTSTPIPFTVGTQTDYVLMALTALFNFSMQKESVKSGEKGNKVHSLPFPLWRSNLKPATRRKHNEVCVVGRYISVSTADGTAVQHNNKGISSETQQHQLLSVGPEPAPPSARL